jgi:tRNA(Ile)-lysidine synthase
MIPMGAPVGSPIPEEVVAPLLRRCHFPPPGAAVTCAVSGGADSSALLVLAVAAGLEVEAVHIDHGLRDGSGAEAAVVAGLAVRLGASFRRETVAVRAGGDLEARAREARRSVLPVGTLFGHTADDQAETLVLRLLRGTGPFGLAGMRQDQHPLLALRRSDTVGLCERLGIQYLNDPSNDDPRFRRNRVRHEVLPLLDDVAGRDVVPLLCRLASLQAEQSDLVDALAADLDPTDARAIAASPGPVAAAALRRWWLSETRAGHPPDAASLDRMRDVAAGVIAGCDVQRGWSLRRSGGRLRLVPPPTGCISRTDE